MKIDVVLPSEIVPLYEITKSFTDSPELIPKKTEITSEQLTDFDADIINDKDEFPEGEEKTILHKGYERNPKAIKEKKESVLNETKKLLCEICNFDFADVYGENGYGFAECHHTIPVHQLTSGHKTTLSELAIVCSNCHRILHRSRPVMLTIEALREIVLKCKKTK